MYNSGHPWLLRIASGRAIILVMTLKTAALLAFIGTVLVTALLMWNLIFSVVNVLRGLLPAVVLFPALIYAFAALSVAVFFSVFQRSR